MRPHFHIVKHPLIEHKLTYMRDENRPIHEFRRLLHEVGTVMTVEVSRMLPQEQKTIDNPPVTGTVITPSKIVIVPILRAGLIMAEGVRELLPFARFGFLGFKQSPDHSETKEYLVNLPDPALPAGRTFILVDPMLGTGNTACRAIEILQSFEIPEKSIRFMGLLATPESKEKLCTRFPGVEVYVAGVDPEIDPETGRVVPGVGVISKRLFGE